MDLIAPPRAPRGREVRLIAKIAFAAVLAWWIASLLGAERPAFAAIVPLVALRADDPYSALGVSLIRVFGTVIGIVLGVMVLEADADPGIAIVAAVIVIALVIGLFVRGPNEAVSPVVAVVALIVLVLGPGEAADYGLERIWETLLGAAIAIVVAMIVWPPDPIAGLRDLVRDLAREVVGDLDAVAALPGKPVRDAERLLDERVRAAMGTSDSTRILDRASSALRWNPRHRRRRQAFWGLAVRIRQLIATSRYTRSMVWSMVAEAEGDDLWTWSPAAGQAFTATLGQLAVGVAAVAAGSDPTGAMVRARADVARFANEAGSPTPGGELVRDLQGAVRQVLRVMDPATAGRLETLLRERYGGA